MLVLVFFALCIVSASGLAVLLRRRRPGWKVGPLVLAAAAPIPAALLAVCVWIGVDVALTPAAKCGVDACGMAIAGAFFIALGALAGWVVGAAAAGLLLSMTRR